MTYLKLSSIQTLKMMKPLTQVIMKNMKVMQKSKKVKMKVRITPIKVRILMKKVPEQRYYRASEKWQKKFCTKVLDVSK